MSVEPEGVTGHIDAVPFENVPPPDGTTRRRGIVYRLLPRTLSARLTTGVVALVALIVMAVGASTYVALNIFLTDRLDQQLQSVAQPASSSLADCLTFGHCPPLTGTTGVHGPQKQWLAIYQANGEPVSLTAEADSDVIVLHTSAEDTQQLLAHPNEPQSVRTTNGVSLRAVAVPNRGFIVITGLWTGEVDTTLHRLIVLELSIGAGAIVIAFLLTTYGVRLSLRQLHKVTRTAQTVTAELSPEGGGLNRRVDVTEPETEVGQLATSVNTLLSAVEEEFGARVESEARMRQFLADASHELRTPLTSIRGYAELARMRRQSGAQESAAASADALDRIESEGTRMSRLVDDLLILARSDRGSVIHRELIDAGELVDDAVMGARAAYPLRRIDVSAQPGLMLVGDRDQLLRVLRNLITNAAIHTDPAGPIAVRAARDGDSTVFQVKDSGPGLPPEEASQVFGRFWRADKARTRARGGSGLGLSIVASIVEAHHGTVTFESSVSDGSLVTVVLPVAADVAP
ncbi:two-component system OmpR family sensor kinase [Jatrophihabitans sp. GAS493]|uniref:sensor histidine kinase n=1 Tax=Jatrophihabitans sp. GAS493 TaxID=1907575 RepID=UPI000BB88BFD|nr:HAMP domain-containing sensor histidine kinase [Jatrophihabitans sp. GAS493]SOD74294.1 two-component system OmpR family sensor kinase [Jatrophihabitans sp. GAS493]